MSRNAELAGRQLDEALLRSYDAARDTPPPLPLEWKTAREAGFGGSRDAHSAVCSAWAVTGRACICTQAQLDARTAAGGGCVCFAVLSKMPGAQLATGAAYAGERPFHYAYLPCTQQADRHAGPVQGRSSDSTLFSKLLGFTEYAGAEHL